MTVWRARQIGRLYFEFLASLPRLDRLLHVWYVHSVMQNENSTRENWAILPRGDAARWSGMYVTLNPMGKIALSRTTHERFGAPAAVLIMYDPIRAWLGLRPVPPETLNAYPIRKYQGNGGRIIRAYRLLTEFGIQPAETIEFQQPKIDGDGQLILDLKNIRVSPRAHGRSKRRRQA